MKVTSIIATATQVTSKNYGKVFDALLKADNVDNFTVGPQHRPTAKYSLVNLSPQVEAAPGDWLIFDEYGTRLLGRVTNEEFNNRYCEVQYKNPVLTGVLHEDHFVGDEGLRHQTLREVGMSLGYLPEVSDLSLEEYLYVVRAAKTWKTHFKGEKID